MAYMAGKFMSAIDVGDVETVKDIIRTDHGDCMKISDWKGKTCIHIAAEKGRYEIMRKLLKIDSSLINQRTSTRHHTASSPLHLAAQNNHHKLVELLLKYGADVDAKEVCSQRTALHVAACSGHLATIKLLLKFGANVADTDIVGNTALILANRSNTGEHFSVIQYLLAKGCPVNHLNELNETALYFAVCNGQQRVVELLTASGADASICPLHTMNFINEPIAGETPMGQGCTMLHLAVKIGSVNLIDTLVLDADVDINKRNIEMESAFMLACKLSKVDAARRLLEFDCNVDVCSKNIVMRKLRLPSYSWEDDIHKMLKEHYVKLMALNRDLSCHNFNYFKSKWFNITPFYERCQLQIELMKKTEVTGGGPNHRVTCYDILKDDLLRTSKLLCRFHEPSVPCQVPLYDAMIACRLSLVRKRLNLINTLQNDFKNPETRPFFLDLPDNCVDQIFLCLSNQDLKNTILALAGSLPMKRIETIEERGLNIDDLSLNDTPQKAEKFTA